MMVSRGCLALVLLLALVLFPIFYADLMVTAMEKLGMSPATALWIVGGVVLGSLINVPVKKIPRDQTLDLSYLNMYGIPKFLPSLKRSGPYTVVAVNVGGFVVPMLVAAYEIARITVRGTGPMLSLLVVALLDILVCYIVARPTPGIGITMTPLVPPLVAAIGALVTAPGFAPPIAFAAGVLGPVVGADLLHLKDVSRISTGIASIGGAGTFDGIVLSGVIAAFLA